MEWTPEALKAEIDYRQAALRADAAQFRIARRSAPPKRSWWRRVGRRAHPKVPAPRNGHRDAA
ncbi:LmbE family N-acetylglucosaminyl deacetylase [Saccharothrix tamanrassetensis]|uniref:LmbE family N-acetylglucosaminyl deacetylase n=1 Tax=Saccharothrix tamanrassetensis TaxID=1051531 RepID=A0A841CHJ2_9PSEU|nr:hypothetical protein [Saccharothrix tamanrassetensis]MBB5955834.1 LmbE family N-acetylglucosaminyl deacetylase [Saccharothrix tamanrassetensis]